MGEKILFLQDYFPNVRECLLSILESPAGILMLIMSWLYQCRRLLMSLSSEPAIPTHASSFTCNWGSILNHKLRHGTTQLKNQIKTRNQLYDFDQSQKLFFSNYVTLQYSLSDLSASKMYVMKAYIDHKKYRTSQYSHHILSSNITML